MISVETVLEKLERENRPIRPGLIGAGYMGRRIVLQLSTPLTGMRDVKRERGQS